MKLKCSVFINLIYILIKTVKRFLMFRDDVSIHLTGSDDEIKKAVKIIGSGYPPLS